MTKPLNGGHKRKFMADIIILGQATKSVEWMPWHREPMKDVISCEKLGGVANRL